MSSFTPGNWYAALPFYVHSDHEGIIEGTHTVVCRASSIDDAKLIAAAPELLEALEIVEPIIDEITASVEPGRMIRAAIAKARGEE